MLNREKLMGQASVCPFLVRCPGRPGCLANFVAIPNEDEDEDEETDLAGCPRQDFRERL